MSIAGRVMSKRVMGKASFCNVQDMTVPDIRVHKPMIFFRQNLKALGKQCDLCGMDGYFPGFRFEYLALSTVGETRNTQEQDINQLLKVRREKLATLQENGKDPFLITKYDVTHHRWIFPRFSF